MRRVRPSTPLRCSALLVILLANDAGAALTTNRWTLGGNGKWEIAANWSAGIPAKSNAAILITNTSSKTVTIDATTSGNFSSTMTISNLMVSGLSNTVNSLVLSNTSKQTPL